MVWLVDGSNNYYQIVVNVDVNNRVISRQSGDEVTTKPVSLINLGLPTNDQERLIMGINSGDARSAKNFLYPRGLTITEYSNTGMPNLFLGDLSSLGNNYSGYGLYGNNVYLNGSLTTRVASGSYAGVNTLTEVSAEIFSAEKIELKADSWIPNKYYIYDSVTDKYILADGSFDSSQTYYEKDTSNIVFWAGAKGTGDANIQSAPF